MEYSRDRVRDRNTDSLAVGLGWFSLALGAAEILATDRLAELIGIRPDGRTRSLLRAYGAREITSGVAILANPHAASPMWSRVVGDAIDLATFGAKMADEDTDRERLGIAAAAVAGVTALDIICAQRLSQAEPDEDWPRQGMWQVDTPRAHRSRSGATQVHIERVTTLNRSVEEAYAFWKDFTNFPRFMRHLESVELLGDNRSRWRAKAPAGMTIQWDAELIEAREPELIAWRSLPNSQVEHSGTVRFSRAPGARGTEVHVTLDYAPPAGTLGRTIAWLFREEPDQQIHEDLHRFKQLIETGEVPLSDGPLMWRAAQPAANADELRTAAGVRS